MSNWLLSREGVRKLWVEIEPLWKSNAINEYDLVELIAKAQAKEIKGRLWNYHLPFIDELPHADAKVFAIPNEDWKEFGQEIE